MKIKVIAVGKLKKGYIKEGVCDFSTRLLKYANLEIVEVKDEKTEEKMSDAEERLIKSREGSRILSNIGERDYVVALDIAGRQLDTLEFAEFLKARKMESAKQVVFVIGGSIGLCDSVLQRADFRLSFSKMTFPHGLMRLILLEQIYRAERVLGGEPYHK